VARTLADLDSNAKLRRTLLAEALSYRRILLGDALR
jgi:predicted ATPase with chaperone activity